MLVYIYCSVLLSDLLADGAVIIGIHDSYFHCGASYIQPIAGGDVEQIPVLLLTVQ